MRRQILPFSLLLLLISCTAFLDNADGVSGTWKNKKVMIENGTTSSIYYFAVEQGTLEVINWAPHSSNENKIESFSNLGIDESEIYGFEKGKTVIFFYWSVKDPKSDQIESLAVKTN